MLICSLIFVFVLTSLVVKTSAKEVPCSSIDNKFWWPHGAQKSCDMSSSIKIDLRGFSISSPKDDDVKGMSFNSNRKIFYLPERINEKFSNLMILEAAGCSIKAISSDNFQGLTQLEALYLSGNQIEKIFCDTFENLTSLEWLHLRKI